MCFCEEKHHFQTVRMTLRKYSQFTACLCIHERQYGERLHLSDVVLILVSFFNNNNDSNNNNI